MSIILRINNEKYEGSALKTRLGLIQSTIRADTEAFIAALEAADESRPWLRAHKRIEIDLDRMEISFDGMRLSTGEIGTEYETTEVHITMYRRIVADLTALHLRCVVTPTRHNCLYIDPFAGDQRLPVNIRWLGGTTFTFLYQRDPPNDKFSDEISWAEVITLLTDEPLTRAARNEHERDELVELIDLALRLRRLPDAGDLLEKTRRLVEELALMPDSTLIDEMAARFAETSKII